MNAIFKKELRDLIRWTPLGILLGLVMLWMEIPRSVYEAAKMETTLMSQLGLTAAVVAIAYGLWQSLFDIRNDARGYLLQRPVSPRQIYWGKVAAGAVAYAITLAVPVIFAAVYLQTKGIEELPTSAAQVVPFVLYSTIIFLLHPLTLWIVHRDARWVGLRMLPAVGAVTVILLFNMIFFDSSFAASGLGVLLLAAVYIVTGSIIFLASRHAFEHQSQLPPRSSHRWSSIACTLGLLVSGLTLWGFAVGFVAALAEPSGDYVTYRLTMDRSGSWKEVERRLVNHNWEDIVTSFRDVKSDQAFTRADGDLEESNQSAMVQFQAWHHPLRPLSYLAGFSSDKVFNGAYMLVRHRDQLLIYGQSNRLLGILTPNGFTKDVEQAEGQFENVDLASNLYVQPMFGWNTATNPLLADDNGLYQLSVEESTNADGAPAFTLRKLSDEKPDAITMLLAADDVPATLWTVVGNELRKQELRAADGGDMPRADSEVIKATRQIKLPPIEIVNTESYALDPIDQDRFPSLNIFRQADRGYAMTRDSHRGEPVEYFRLNGSSFEKLGSVKLPPTQTSDSALFIAWAFPPAAMALFGFVSTMILGNTDVNPPPWMITMVVLHVVCAGVVALLLAKRFEITGRSRIRWIVTALFAGLGTSVAMLAIYRRPVKEPCPRCDASRRVDLETCHQCGNPWDAPEQDGIEMFENACKIGVHPELNRV